MLLQHMLLQRAVEEFEQAWSNPSYTRFELPPMPVNEVLNEKYTVSSPLRLSREMVWDMELKKAWDPATFIPSVVSKGRSWGRHQIEVGSERFFRSSTQLSWLSDGYGTVLEEVFVDHKQQKILFLGRDHFETKDGLDTASNFQPLFHVEHAVGGSVDRPLNLWRIVILTRTRDERYTERLQEASRQGFLPEFLEIYIERQFGCTLKKNSPNTTLAGFDE